jgi:hypothetical protein
MYPKSTRTVNCSSLPQLSVAVESRQGSKTIKRLSALARCIDLLRKHEALTTVAEFLEATGYSRRRVYEALEELGSPCAAERTKRRMRPSAQKSAPERTSSAAEPTTQKEKVSPNPSKRKTTLPLSEAAAETPRARSAAAGAASAGEKSSAPPEGEHAKHDGEHAAHIGSMGAEGANGSDRLNGNRHTPEADEDAEGREERDRFIKLFESTGGCPEVPQRQGGAPQGGLTSVCASVSAAARSSFARQRSS